MSPLIIANWKMHFSLSEAITACNKLAGSKFSNNLIIAPPAPYLAHLAISFPTLNFSAQDVSALGNTGAYTGEYSADMLKSSQINYAIIGHSERRNLFNETSEIIKKKADLLCNANVVPIICIGETLDIRKKHNYEEFLYNQLQNSFPLFNTDMIIAYEPTWSIGTGVIPTIAELQEAFKIISLCIKQSEVAKFSRLLYGGSVNLNNIEQILKLDHVDGVLIGKASLDPELLIKMLERLY